MSATTRRVHAPNSVRIVIVISTSVLIASDGIFHLRGWAEIPSTYRHPGPVSGQFTGPNNGVTPPYSGQPIPGFSGMIPQRLPIPSSRFRTMVSVRRDVRA
jgi:hypothetical protein